MVFLDLEDTVIDNWFNRNLVNRSIVTEFLDSEREKAGLAFDATLPVGLFSFAVQNDKDKEDFVVNLQPWLERVFNVKFVQVHSTKDILRVVHGHHSVFFENELEFRQLLGKTFGFIHFALALELTDPEFTLVDDTVVNGTKFHTKGTDILFFNPTR